jgi:hypothetical protein
MEKRYEHPVFDHVLGHGRRSLVVEGTWAFLVERVVRERDAEAGKPLSFPACERREALLRAVGGEHRREGLQKARRRVVRSSTR